MGRLAGSGRLRYATATARMITITAATATATGFHTVLRETGSEVEPSATPQLGQKALGCQIGTPQRGQALLACDGFSCEASAPLTSVSWRGFQALTSEPAPRRSRQSNEP